MTTRLTRSEKRALVAIVAGAVLFFAMPWIAACVAVAAGVDR